jgi:glycerophosphoryl diester phosphodiesterase
VWTVEPYLHSNAAGHGIPALLSLERRTVVAHRGGAGLRPENSLLAFEHAASLGVDAIELDVHLSRDGEPVVIHDATLDRTTDARGDVAAWTADDLARVDAGAGFGADRGRPFQGVAGGVPRLAAVFDRLPSIPVAVELKGEDPALADAVLAVAREARALDRIIVGGFGRQPLGRVRLEAPSIPTSASRNEAVAALRRSYLWLSPTRPPFRLYQVPMRLRGRRVLTRQFVRTSRRAGLPVHVWVVDDLADMRLLIDWGVTGLITDRPDVARSVVEREGK